MYYLTFLMTVLRKSPNTAPPSSNNKVLKSLSPARGFVLEIIDSSKFVLEHAGVEKGCWSEPV